MEDQGAGRFRVEAYRRGGGTLRELDDDLQAVIAREGRRGLEALPGIGRARAAAVVVKARRQSATG